MVAPIHVLGHLLGSARLSPATILLLVTRLVKCRWQELLSLALSERSIHTHQSVHDRSNLIELLQRIDSFVSVIESLVGRIGQVNVVSCKARLRTIRFLELRVEPSQLLLGVLEIPMRLLLLRDRFLILILQVLKLELYLLKIVFSSR